jgi:hypothetical protein
MSARVSRAHPLRALALSERFPDFRDIRMGRGPVRTACIAMEHQRVRFQLRLEIFSAERNRLVVVVRTSNFEIQAVAQAVTSLIGNSSTVRVDRPFPTPDDSATPLRYPLKGNPAHPECNAARFPREWGFRAVILPRDDFFNSCVQ